MVADAVVGKDCILYYNTGTAASPTWVAITDAIDVNVELTKNEADVSSRASSYKMFGAGQKVVGITFGYLHNKGADTVFDALLGHFTADTKVQLAAMDGAIATAGNQGLKAYMICFGMSQGQELEDGVRYEFSYKPCRFIESSAIVPPAWLEVSA